MRAVPALALALALAPACGGGDQKDDTTTPSAGDMAAAAASRPATEPPPDAEPPPTDVDPTLLAEDTVFFAADSHELDDAAKQALGEAVAWMEDNPERRMVIYGHASDAGEPTDNLTLGNNRANAIREYLVSQGIEVGRISVVSHGESGPELGPDVERRAVYVTER